MKNYKNVKDFLAFTEEIALRQQMLGKSRTSETYKSAAKSLRLFVGNRPLSFQDITDHLMSEYEHWLYGRGVCRNTVSFYMRILRASYHKGVRSGFCVNTYPFRDVYTGVDRTQKRALALHDLRLLRSADMSFDPVLSTTRDLFLFSFYTRGMAFVDMAHLTRNNLVCDILVYRRQKTGQQLSIHWEKCMQEIIERYHPSGDYLLPIMSSVPFDRKEYGNKIHQYNLRLKLLSQHLGIPPLSSYVSRHSWASVAWNQRIPLSIISEGMGHDSEKTTRIYLSTLNNSYIDAANRKILNRL